MRDFSVRFSERAWRPKNIRGIFSRYLYRFAVDRISQMPAWVILAIRDFYYESAVSFIAYSSEASDRRAT